MLSSTQYTHVRGFCANLNRKNPLFFVDSFTREHLELLIDLPKADSEKNFVGIFLKQTVRNNTKTPSIWSGKNG